MRRKLLNVFTIMWMVGFHMNQNTKGCEDFVSISSMSSVSEIKIEKRELNQNFIDAWIDDLEKSSETVSFSQIITITLKECCVGNGLSYDIFHDFFNVKELNILHCDLGSKDLSNLLSYINPHSLSRLNLSESNFSCFDEKDFTRIKSLFSLSEIVLPVNMDHSSQIVLQKIFGHPKLIISDFLEKDKRINFSIYEIDYISNKIAEYEKKVGELCAFLERVKLYESQPYITLSHEEAQINQITEDQIRLHILKMKKSGYTHREIGVFLGYSHDTSTGKAAVSSFLNGSKCPDLCSRYKESIMKRLISLPDY